MDSPGAVVPRQAFPSGARVIFAPHGIAFFLFLFMVEVGVDGGGDCALYPPPTGYLLVVRHHISGMDRGAGLHRCGSDSGCAVAAWIVSGFSPTTTNS